MTLVELFDLNYIENAASVLALAPERLIIIGDAAPMRRQAEDFARFLRSIGSKTEVVYRPVSTNNLQAVYTLLCDIVEQYPDCNIDLTGGSELLLLATGMVYAQHPQIQLHRINIRSGRLTDCDADGHPGEIETPLLSVEQQILLYGGKVIWEHEGPNGTVRWPTDAEFVQQVERIFSLCCENPQYWNRFTGAMAELCSRYGDGSLALSASQQAVEYAFRMRGIRYSADFLALLEKRRLIEQLCLTDGLCFRFASVWVQHCLTQAGHALEQKVYHSARNMKDKDGAPYFHDALVGVSIDWDSAPDDPFDTVEVANEIDVMLMRGLCPVFISCKNGTVTHDELYKLHTVAERFGADYAKKMLIVTSFRGDARELSILAERAREMNIALLPNAARMTDEQLAARLRGLAP